jgi:2-dehydropantoate 2-reductase
MAALLILGTGALAAYFGFQLASTGVDLSLLGTWQEGVEALNQHGIRLIDGEQEKSCRVKAYSSPDQVPPARFALVLVKSWQTERAAEQLRRVLAPDGLALTLQNGLGNREILSRLLGEERTAQGVTTMGATLLGPGTVRPGGAGEITVGKHPRVQPLIELLRTAGLEVHASEDLPALIWQKLAINCAINPLTALLQVPNGKLLESRAALAVMTAAAEEARQVALAEGVRPQPGDLPEAVRRVARKTAENRSSMLQDVLRGAPSEIDAICGEVVRRGARHGVSTPVNHMFVHLIKALIDTKEISV